MKRCPECRRDYYDDTLLYCLDDGTQLLDGPASAERKTMILSEARPFAKDLFASFDGPGESPTQPQIDQTAKTAILPSGTGIAAHTSKLSGKRMAVLIGFTAILVAGGFFGYRYFLPGNASISSIAVLPFENASGDPNLDYLSDGLSESVIDRLSQLGQLKVVARNSSFRYRAKNPDLPQIAAALGVQAIVTGRVTKRGDSFFVHAELTDVRQNNQLWGDNFNSKATDAFSVQEEIAQSVVKNLRVKLTGTQEQQLSKHETTNPAAYELVLQARFFARKGGTESRKKAIDYLNQAIAVDPNYALAYAVLATRYNSLISNSIADPREFLPKAEAAALKALELDESLAEAHYAQAIVKSSTFDWETSEREFHRAIELNPNLARAHGGFAGYLSIRGRHEQAIAEIKRAKFLDPLSPVISANYGPILYRAGRNDEAISYLNQMLELDRGFGPVHLYLADSYSAKKMYPEAVTEYQEAIRLGEDSTSTQIRLGASYASSGDSERARSILKQVKSGENYVSPSELAKLHEALGERDEAIKLLENALSERDVQLQYLGVDPQYDGLRREPRFTALLSRLGLSQTPR